MSKSKLERYRQVQTFRNVLDFSHYRPNIMYDSRGEWRSHNFKNQNPIIVELACGKGEYTVALAQKYPQKNFIGYDIKGERIWKGAGTALDHELENVLFIRGFIDHITNVFGRGEVDEIWITFPDPYLKDRKENKRLTSPVFLERYRQILKPGGLIHLKTDSVKLFDYTLEVIDEQGLEIVEKNDDIYGSSSIPDILAIKTFYENQHLEEGKPIRYLAFRFR